MTAQSLHLGFAERTGKADSWRPVERISLKPTVQFGQPCIDGTRIPTSSIWGYIRAGDPSRFIADAYGVDIADVERAVRWEELSGTSEYALHYRVGSTLHAVPIETWRRRRALT